MYVVFEARDAEDISQRVFRGVFPTKEEAIDSVLKNHRLSGEDGYDTDEELNEWIKDMLEEYSATDGLSLCYMIEPLENNQWVDDIITSHHDDVQVSQYLNKEFILFNFNGEENKNFIHRAVYQMVRCDVTTISDFCEYGLHKIKDDELIQKEIQKLKSENERKVIAKAIEHNATFYLFYQDGCVYDEPICFVAIYNI